MSQWIRPIPLERIGLTVQVLKTALAAGGSWELAVWLLGSDKPYLAPVAAILCGQVTVADSIRRGSQRVMGVVGGIALSLAAVHFLGLTAWSVAVLVLIGMATATAMGFGGVAVTQVAVSGLLVMSLGAAPDYAARRLLDTILGALVAVVVNAVVWTPDATPAAARELGRLAERAAVTVEELGQRCLAGRSLTAGIGAARELSSQVEQLRESLRLARESLLYSPFAGSRRADLARLEGALSSLERVTLQVRGVARSVADLTRRKRLLELLAGPLAASAELLHLYAEGLATARGRGPLEEAVKRLRERHRQALSEWEETVGRTDPKTLSQAGSVLADLAKMAADLEETFAPPPGRGG